MSITTQAQIPEITPDPGPLVELFDRLDPVAWFILIVGALILLGVWLSVQMRRSRPSRGSNTGRGLLVGGSLVTLGLVWLIVIS